MNAYSGVFTILGLACFFCVLCFCKDQTYCFVIMCVCIPPGKAIPEMIYTVSGGTLNPTRLLTQSEFSQHCKATELNQAQCS